MSGSSFGTCFRICTFGESHGTAVGAVVDGCPAGLILNPERIQPYLDRRKPGQSLYASMRKEEDHVEITSGVFEGKTTGAPITLIIQNKDAHAKDYSELMDLYRPGHADYSYEAKYGFRDYRGGGRASGRETIARVAAGAIASLLLLELGIEVFAYTKSIGPIAINPSLSKKENCCKNTLYMPDLEAAKAAEQYLDEMKKQKDSAGGIIECIASGIPAGIGEPVFDKLDANLAKAIMSIGAVKGIEFGSGFAASYTPASINNDEFTMEKQIIKKNSNHAGGILGGISDGSDIILRAAIKPTPSIGKAQQTINKDGEITTIHIHGRHDTVIVPRVAVVVECMTAITILDLLLQSMSSKLENIKKFFS